MCACAYGGVVGSSRVVEGEKDMVWICEARSCKTNLIEKGECLNCVVSTDLVRNHNQTHAVHKHLL